MVQDEKLILLGTKDHVKQMNIHKHLQKQSGGDLRSEKILKNLK